MRFLRTLTSAGLFSTALWFEITRFSRLEYYGLHVIGIAFLLFYGLTLLGMTIQANDAGYSEKEHWKAYRKYMLISHGALIGGFSLLWGIRRGIKYLFNHILPPGWQGLDEIVFGAVFLGIIGLVYYLAGTEFGRKLRSRRGKNTALKRSSSKG